MNNFDLEKAVAAWRRFHLHRRVFLDDDLNELESHLRDHFAHLIQTGIEAEEAFLAAVQTLGDLDSGTEEYRKVYWGKLRRHHQWTNELKWQAAMFKNYLMVALRNARRYPGYTFINVFGLAIGLASCLLIALFVQHERGYDRFHAKADRIHRVVTDVQPPGDAPLNRFASVAWPVGPTLATLFPEVERVAHVANWDPTIRHNGFSFKEEGLVADTNFLEVFSFVLVAGDPQTALRDPFSLVLTETLAHKYFGDEPALGQSLLLNDSLTFTVTGVLQDLPEQSHITFGLLTPIATLCATGLRCDTAFSEAWFDLNLYNYLLLREGVDPAVFEAKIADLMIEHAGDYFRRIGYQPTLRMEALSDIYMRSDRGNRLGPSSDIAYVYLLSMIGLFVLLIACINFMNLATARATGRAREVGIRKAVGSSRGALVRQFLSESVLTCTCATLLALGIATLAIPLFNDLSGIQLARRILFTPIVSGSVIILTLLIGLTSGLYPAVVLSRYKPALVLKGIFATGRGGIRLRQGLVIIQFAISCALFVGTLVILEQVRYMRGQHLGFDDEHVLVLTIPNNYSSDGPDGFETIKQAFEQQTAVRSATVTMAVPGYSGSPKVTFPEGRETDQGIMVEYIPADHQYAGTLGLKFVAGRDFSTDFETDRDEALLINEQAVQAMGWDTPELALGKTITAPSGAPKGTVVGIVKDFHQHGLQEEIRPMVISAHPSYGRFLALRLDQADYNTILEDLESIWDQFYGGYPFTYFFLDDDFNRQYQAEQRLVRIFAVFAALAILIACLGLFGLASFSIRQRTKEIGIRKVMGASVVGLVTLLSREFLKLVGFAFVIAIPVAYFGMRRWLEDFAYHIEISGWIFLVAGLAALLIALLTVGYQSVKTAMANPVRSLRYE